MSEPFLAEIIMFGGNFAPNGWAKCNGALLPINQNQSLFSLLGTTFGGDGRTSFGLPDLRGRAPVHPDTINLGQKGGPETVTLNANELPDHDHKVQAASAAATSGLPTGNVLAQFSIVQNVYGDPNNLVAMNPAAVADTGGGASHTNMQPFLAVCFIIALQGLFPSRN